MRFGGIACRLGLVELWPAGWRRGRAWSDWRIGRNARTGLQRQTSVLWVFLQSGVGDGKVQLISSKVVGRGREEQGHSRAT